MKFKDLFKNPVKEEIGELTNNILNEQWNKEISKAIVESTGIINGRKIIFDFLDVNENGYAYEHLDYIISELDINLTSDQIIKMDKIGRELNVK